MTYSRVWYEFTAGLTGNYMVTGLMSDGNPEKQYYSISGRFSQMVTEYNNSYLKTVDSGEIGNYYDGEKPLVVKLEKGKKYYLSISASWLSSDSKLLPITIRISPNVKTIIYDANGGDNAPSMQAVTPGKAVTISGDWPNRDVYTFLGWSKSKTATSATYLPGDTITTNGDLTLYAIWKKAKSLGTISADKTVNLTCKMTYSRVWYEFTAGLTGNYMVTGLMSNGNPERQYYSISGRISQMIMEYNNTYTETIDSGEIGSSYNTVKPLVIKLEKGKKYYLGISASWMTGETKTLPLRLSIGVPSTGANARTVTYDANGGTLGSVPAKQTVEANKAVELSWDVPYREHYNFLGWSKSKTATAAEYLPSGSFTTGTNTTLYAVWDAEKYLGTLLMETKRQVTCSIPQAERWYAFKADCSGTYTIEIGKSGESTYVKAALYGAEGKLEETTTESTQEGLTLSAWLDEGETYSLCLKPYWDNGQNAAFDLTFGIPRMTSRLVLPFNLREIRERAYAGTEFGSIVVPEGVETVGPYAFADCAELTKIIVLSADTDFADTAFEGCAGLTFLAPAGSTAQAFAGAHGYSFEAYVP